MSLDPSKKLENIKRLGELKEKFKRYLDKILNVTSVESSYKQIEGTKDFRIEFIVSVCSAIIPVDDKEFQGPSISSGITITLEMFEGTDDDTLMASMINAVRNEVAASAISLYTKPKSAPHVQ